MTANWWYTEMALGIIYESARDVNKRVRLMKHNAWGFCTLTIKGRKRFTLYGYTDGEPEYICMYNADESFESISVWKNEEYVTE